MSLDSDVKLLRELRVFADLSEDQLRLLAFSAGHRTIAKGESLFTEGEVAQGGFAIATGSIELSRGEGDKRTVLATCEPGSLIGELALFIETKRSTSAVALADSELLELNRGQVTRMLIEYGPIAARIRAQMTDRLQSTIGELADIKTKLDEIDQAAKKRRR